MFKSIKSRGLPLVHASISRFWVQPLDERVIPLLEKKPGWLSNHLLRWASWWANAGRVIVNEMRLLKTRWVGPDWSVTYLGNGKSAEILCCSLFPALPEEVESTRISLWQVPALVRKHAQEGDLVVCELNQIIRLFPRGVDLALTTPRMVNQVIVDFDRPLDEIINDIQPHIRKRIKQFEAQGYSFEATHSEADFDLFYHHMYLPYITGRHTGRSLDLCCYDLLFRYFKEGVLILAKLHGEPIAGGILKPSGDQIMALEMGVLDGLYERVKQGSNAALWWFELLWAHKLGARVFVLGTSFALTSNGPFNFKRQWGTRVARVPYNHDNWSFFGKDLSSQLREYLSELGLITEVDGKYYQVLLHIPSGPDSEAKLANQLFHLSRCGIVGMMLISAEGEKQLIPSEAVRQDPTGRRYLADPHFSAR
jgi:hypothetical protein